MNGGSHSETPVTSWQVRAAGGSPSALARHSGRMRWDEAKGWSRTAARMGRSAAETNGTLERLWRRAPIRQGLTMATNATAARVRLGMNVNGLSWAAAAEARR